MPPTRGYDGLSNRRAPSSCDAKTKDVASELSPDVAPFVPRTKRDEGPLVSADRPGPNDARSATDGGNPRPLTALPPGGSSTVLGQASGEASETRRDENDDFVQVRSRRRRNGDTPRSAADGRSARKPQTWTAGGAKRCPTRTGWNAVAEERTFQESEARFRGKPEMPRTGFPAHDSGRGLTKEEEGKRRGTRESPDDLADSSRGRGEESGATSAGRRGRTDLANSAPKSNHATKMAPRTAEFERSGRNATSAAGGSSKAEDDVRKKKKTDGQRKKDYKNKVKSLPAVRGKVTTVTREFYDSVRRNEPEGEDGAGEARFGPGDFPTLGEDPEGEKLASSFGAKGSPDPDSDSDWSDVDPGDGPAEPGKTQGKGAGKTLPRNHGVDEPGSRSYAASLKKSKSPSKGEDGADANAEGSPAPTSRASKPEKGRKPKARSSIECDLMSLLNRKKTVLKDFNGKKTAKVKPVVANILDSSAPSRKRGKERETPAKKRLTPMKKVILREREARKSKTQAPQAEVHVEAPVEQVESREEKPEDREPAIHSRKFREYCHQMLDPEIDGTVTNLIQDLVRFQDRLYQKDPIKAKMRRRMVFGLREIAKHLKLKKLKCVVLAPNLEKIISDGGLDEAMRNIIALAVEQGVPFVFALGRRGLGRVCLKKVPVSGVGIFNYDGSEDNFKQLRVLAGAAQEAYGEATRQGP